MKIRLVQFDATGAWSDEQLLWLNGKLNQVFDAERGDDGYWRPTGDAACAVHLVDDEIEELSDCAGCAGFDEDGGWVDPATITRPPFRQGNRGR